MYIRGKLFKLGDGLVSLTETSMYIMIYLGMQLKQTKKL